MARNKGKNAKKKAQRAPRLVLVPESQVVKRPNGPKQTRPRKQGRASGAVAAVARKACSLTDPFCTAAFAAKYTDGSSARTMTEQCRGTIFPTNTAGAGSITFVANPVYNAAAGTLSAGTYTLDSAFTSLVGSTMVQTYASRYRITSWGVRMFQTASMTNASGRCIIGVNDVISLSGTFAQGTTRYQEMDLVSLADPMAEHIFISKPLGANAHSFIAAPGNTTFSDAWTSVTYDWTGSGSTSGNAVGFEVVYNIEFEVSGVGNALSPLATPAAPLQPIVQMAADSVQRAMPSLIQKGVTVAGKMIEAMAMRAAAGLLARSGPMGAAASTALTLVAEVN